MDEKQNAGRPPLPRRRDISPGQRVRIIEKQNQSTGAVSTGIVARILTRSPSHPHGIKVQLEDGRVGRVQAVEGADRNEVTSEPECSKEAPSI